MATYPKIPLRLRWWGLLLGMFTLLWLPIEDVTTTYLVVLSVAWCAWLAALAAWRGWLAQKRWRIVWLGGLAGLCIFPVELAFIIFKAGIHAHGFLDFSLYQISRLARLTPLWCMLGGLLGAVISRATKQ